MRGRRQTLATFFVVACGWQAFAEEPVYSVTLSAPEVTEDIFSEKNIPASPEEPRRIYLSSHENQVAHVIVKNISSQPHLLFDSVCEPQLIEQLSFEIKDGPHGVDKISCGHPHERCFRNFAVNYVLQPGEDYVFNLDAKSCGWRTHFAKELEMRAVFDRSASPWKRYILK